VSSNPLARHFMVEVNERRIRFGDDVFGAIPETNALITCTRYLLLDGPPVRETTPPADHALTVRAGDIHHIVRLPAAPPLPAGVTLDVVDNTDAEGGANFFARSRRFEKGLSQFRTPYRLITKADFERAVLEDFNAFQRLSRSTPEVLNVSVVFDKRPTTTSGPSELEDAQSHVTLVPLFAATTVPVAILWERMRRFLDPRRLITTRLNFMAPQYRQVDVNAAVVVAADRNVADVDAALRSRIAGFLSVERGELDGRGWRLGRNVYESQIARVLEETDGVDHVTQLALNPADAEGNVEIAPHQLPQLRTLTLAVGRE
jgi:hypothetical protein